MKMRHTVIAIALASAGLSAYADQVQTGAGHQAQNVIEYRAGKSRPDYEAWINANKPPHVRPPSAKELLEAPPFAPTDVDLFMPETYSAAAPSEPAPAPDTPITEQQLSWQVNQISGRAGLKVINDPALEAKMPDARLRAALATLPGSPLAGSIDAIKSDVYSSVEFGVPTPSSAIAQVVDDGTGHGKIIVNSIYQHEDIRLLGSALGHEGLHQDPANSNREELINNTLESLTYARFVKKDPSLARQGNELTRRENTKLMGLLNSRDEDGNIHLLSAQGDTVYPGTDNPNPLRYFGQRFVEAGLGADTPGNAALTRAVRDVTKKRITNASFNDATLNLLDQNINLFSADDWIKVAKALKLDIDD
ncbi:MAG: hypothetical protein WAW41_07140 [Methylobacter sp.]